MENFIPADGKSIGFTRALQFAVPIPPVETLPVVSNDGGGKGSSSNQNILKGAIVVVGIVAFYVGRWYQRQYGVVKQLVTGDPTLPEILKPTEDSKSTENSKPPKNPQQPYHTNPNAANKEPEKN